MEDSNIKSAKLSLIQFLPFHLGPRFYNPSNIAADGLLQPSAGLRISPVSVVLLQKERREKNKKNISESESHSDP